MARPSRFFPKVRERVVRMVFEHAQEHASQWAAIISSRVCGRDCGGWVRDIYAAWRCHRGEPFQSLSHAPSSLNPVCAARVEEFRSGWCPAISA